jgi:hypothetical protein
VNYTNTDYSELCEEAEAGGHIVKLGRPEGGGWALQVVVVPRGKGASWRAAGALFPDVVELERHATYLLHWLRAL